MKIFCQVTAKIKNFPELSEKPLLVLPFTAEDARLPKTGDTEVDELCQNALENAPAKMKAGSSLALFHPKAGAIVLLATVSETNMIDLQSLGHAAIGAASAHQAQSCRVLLANTPSENIAEIALGARLSHYSFRSYWNKKAEDVPEQVSRLEIFCDDPTKAQAAADSRLGIAEGVSFSRDLISEPSNVLYPETFAKRLQELQSLGLKVEVLDQKALKKLGMNALLGVAQGSSKAPYVVVMHWDHNKEVKNPTALVGKGVTFDTGGISIKPAANMEEMKFDMGGAGVVSGVMKAIAVQKAQMNVVGVVGLVENMPDGNAQRPGDVVTAMDGQTIAVHNTDAEGRLVLADILHYTNQRFSPTAMVDLATLTGAVIIALGSEYAGLFSNNDELSASLTASSEETDEKLWRLPLHKNYDKQLDTLVADMCNIGGREAGSITAAQFLQRFVGKTPWAHLDIAGVTWNTKGKPTYPAGASGFGVKLLYHWLNRRFQTPT